MIRSFNSTCESIATSSLVVGVYGLPKGWEARNSIQNTPLDLSRDVLHLSLLSALGRTNVGGNGGMRKLFSRIYEVGVVIEKFLHDEDSVSRYFQTSKLLY